jgi:hypothetical protein
VSSEENYGLGLDIRTVSGRTVIGHGGGFNGFITRVSVDPELDLGVVVLSNAINGSANGIATGIFEAIYELLDKHTFYFGGVKKNYAKYEGVYRNVWGDDIVLQIGNRLISIVPPTVDSPLLSPVVYLPTDKPHEFLTQTKNVKGDVDETTTFSSLVKGKMQKVSFGPTPAKRVV